MFERTLNKNLSCPFLYDPMLTIKFPKYKVLLIYLEEASRFKKIHEIKLLGCNVLVRSDLDSVVLFYALQDSKEVKTALGFKKLLNNYFIYVYEDNEEVCRLRFNETKYIFEVV